MYILYKIHVIIHRSLSFYLQLKYTLFYKPISSFFFREILLLRMAADIISLPPEIRERVYVYCEIRDLAGISCCSKAYHESVKHMLWEKVELPWKYVKETRFTDSMLKNFSYTRRLTFYRTREEVWDSDIEPRYVEILQHCNYEKVEFLGVINFWHDNGMKYMANTLHNLREMSIWNTANISTTGWRCIVYFM